MREEVRWVAVPVVEWSFVAREGWRGCGRKQKEKMREIRGWRGARQAQIIETLASREDQSAASEFVSGEVSMEHVGGGGTIVGRVWMDALVKSWLSTISESS